MAFLMDTGQRLALFGLDGQPAGDTSAFLRAVEVKLPEERQDSEFHTDMENANKLADAWSLREESYLKGLNDTNAAMEVFARAQHELIVMGINLPPATKPCDSCGGEFEIGSFSRKEWIAAGWGRCRSCVQNGNPVRYSEYYRPAVPYSSKIDDSNLCHPDSLAAILREYISEDYGEDCVERLIKAASEYPMTFKHYLRLYYYKYKLLSGLKKAGASSDVVNNVRRAIYDIPDYSGKDPTFRKITERIRQAMSKGKKKLRLACKEVFLSVDRNVTIKFDDDNETREAALKTRIAASDGSGGRAMDLPEVRAYAERSFASCSVTYPVDMLSGDSARAVMQRKLHAIISRAEEDGRLREIDWGSEPTPNLDPEEVAQETAADGFVPSIERLVDDLVPMLRPEPSDHIDRLLNKASDGTPLTSEQRNHPDWIKLARRFFDFYVGSKKNDGIDVGIFNRCVERQRDEFRQQRYKPTDPGLPLRRRCDLCYVDNALAEWRYPYCNSCNVYWLSPNFRRMDEVDAHCPICLRWPTRRILVYPSMRPHATLKVPGVRKVRQSGVSRRKDSQRLSDLQ